MRKFTLLVNGVSLDTGSYEYLPYADKSIVDFKTTLRTTQSLKKGKMVPNAKDFIYAQYCVGNETTNKEALEAAHKASIKYSSTPVGVRRKILGDIYKNLVEKKEELIEKFGSHPNDSGSSEVQIAVLSERIKNLTDHLAKYKKDQSSKRGLLQLVMRRRKLLDYLKKEDREKYGETIKSLGLRR